MIKHLIVGIDPGTTTAVSLIDLQGDIVDIISSKDMGLSNVIEYIVSHGKPSMIACDVNPIPGFVSKISKTFGVRSFIPEKDLSVNEKIEMARGFNVSDAHQRDALAAALNAFNKYRNMFTKVDSLKLSDEVKHMVLQGNSIEKAERILTSKDDKEIPEKEIVKKETIEQSPEDKKIRSLDKRIKSLMTELDKKDALIAKLKEEIAGIKRKNHTRKEWGNSSVENTIRNYELKISAIKKDLSLKESVKKHLLAVIDDEEALVGIYPEVLDGYCMVRDKVNPKDINVGSFKYVFTDLQLNTDLFRSLGVKVFKIKKLETVDGLWFVDKTDLDDGENMSLEGLIEEYREKR